MMAASPFPAAAWATASAAARRAPAAARRTSFASASASEPEPSSPAEGVSSPSEPGTPEAAPPPPPFVPRARFDVSPSITRPYFLGHHTAALSGMRNMLSYVGLIIECRDVRAPLSSFNPLLERSLAMSTPVPMSSTSSPYALMPSASAAAAPARSAVVSAGGGTREGGAATTTTATTATTSAHPASLSSSPTSPLPPRPSPPPPPAIKPLPASAYRPRIIVYTKSDLLSRDPAQTGGVDVRNALARFHQARGDARAVVFAGSGGSDGSRGRGGRGGSRGGGGPADGMRGASAGYDRILADIAAVARDGARDGDNHSFAGLRALVVGMPNSGKSTLLNRLRERGMAAAAGPDPSGNRSRGKKGGRMAKAAATGAQPGVTRKLGTPVRIMPKGGVLGGGGGGGGGSGDGGGGGGGGGRGRGRGRGRGGRDGDKTDPRAVGPGSATALGDGGVFLVDTPGVFVPHVGDAETMLKLALVGCVKDGLVPSVTIVDYLLYRLNLVDPALYLDRYGNVGGDGDGGSSAAEVVQGRPTNDVYAFLAWVGRRTGKLGKGGAVKIEQTADWVVQEWRRGNLGRFVLDDVGREALAATDARARGEGAGPVSMGQARRMMKEQRKARSEEKRLAGGG